MQDFVFCGALFDFFLTPIDWINNDNSYCIVYQKEICIPQRRKCVLCQKSFIHLCNFLFFPFFAFDFISLDKKKLPRIIFVMFEKITRFIGIFTSQKPSRKLLENMHTKPRLFSIRFFLHLLWYVKLCIKITKHIFWYINKWIPSKKSNKK